MQSCSENLIYKPNTCIANIWPHFCSTKLPKNKSSHFFFAVVAFIFFFSSAVPRVVFLKMKSLKQAERAEEGGGRRRDAASELSSSGTNFTKQLCYCYQSITASIIKKLKQK